MRGMLSSGCSPMNLSVTCSESGPAQRTSGAKLSRPRRYNTIFWRIVSSRSRATKRRMLHQFPANHIEGLLGSKTAHALAVSGEVAFYNVRTVFIGDGVEDQPDRFFRRSACWTCDSSDPNA